MSEPTKSFTVRLPYSLYLNIKDRDGGMNAFIVKALQEQVTSHQPPKSNEQRPDSADKLSA